MAEVLDLDQLVRDTLEGFEPASDFLGDHEQQFYLPRAHSLDYSQNFKDGYQAYVEYPADFDGVHDSPAWFSPASNSGGHEMTSGFISTELDSSEKELMEVVLDLQDGSLGEVAMEGVEVNRGMTSYSDGESLSPPEESPPQSDGAVAFENIMDIYGLPTEGGLNLLDRNNFNQGFFMTVHSSAVDVSNPPKGLSADNAKEGSAGNPNIVNGINMDEALQDAIVEGLLEIDSGSSSIGSIFSPASTSSSSSVPSPMSSGAGISRAVKPGQPSTDDDPDDPKALAIATNMRFEVSNDSERDSNAIIEVKVMDPSKCQVCADKAGKHNYYGGRVCASCRAFFRRAVQSKYHEIFYCTKGERCEMNLVSRRSCQFCRFKRCLAVGMRVGWVLSEVERKRRFDKSRNLPDPTMAPKAIPAMRINSDDLSMIQGMNKFMRTCCERSMTDFITKNPSFMRNLVSLSYFGGTVTYDLYRNFTGLSDQFIYYVLTSLDDFRQLPIGDREKLVNINGQVMNRFKYAISFEDRNSCFLESVELATKSGAFPALAEVAHDLERRQMLNRKPKIDYQQMFASPWAANKEEEETHFALMSKMRSWPRDSEFGPVDQLQVTLMKLIIAFNTESCSLERADIVETAQLRYIGLLQKYLSHKYGKEANQRLVNGLMITSYAKQVYEIQKKRLPI